MYFYRIELLESLEFLFPSQDKKCPCGSYKLLPEHLKKDKAIGDLNGVGQNTHILIFSLSLLLYLLMNSP